jgi:hypothetical protein
MGNRTVGRPLSRALTASGRSHPSFARQASASCTTWGSVRPVHSARRGYQGTTHGCLGPLPATVLRQLEDAPSEQEPDDPPDEGGPPVVHGPKSLAEHREDAQSHGHKRAAHPLRAMAGRGGVHLVRPVYAARLSGKLFASLHNAERFRLPHAD